MQTKTISESLLIAILTLGVFGIINTEMGVVGIIPQIAERFDVTVSTSGLCVSVFALVVSVAAPVLPLLFSGINRRTMMLAALILFVASNILSMVTDSFAVLLAARALPAFLHPVYVAMAFTLAAAATKDDPSRGIARVFVGVSAGMVLGVPMTTFVTTHWSYEAAMGIFAVINTVVLVATFFLVPNMPAKQHNPGHQLRVLKNPSLWLGVSAFNCINGAMFGFFSFMSDFLHEVSAFSFDAVSSVLLAYGFANIAGNMLAGRVFGRYKKLFTRVGPAMMLALLAVVRLCTQRNFCRRARRFARHLRWLHQYFGAIHDQLRCSRSAGLFKWTFLDRCQFRYRHGYLVVRHFYFTDGCARRTLCHRHSSDCQSCTFLCTYDGRKCRLREGLPCLSDLMRKRTRLQWL